MDDGGIRTTPSGKSGIGACRNLTELCAGNNGEEGVAHLGVVGLKLALDIDNECGCDRGEQTGLSPGGVQTIKSPKVSGWNTHKNQGGVHIVVEFLDKVVVKFVGFALKQFVELDVGRWIWEGRSCIVRANGLNKSVGGLYIHGRGWTYCGALAVAASTIWSSNQEREKYPGWGSAYVGIQRE